MVRLRSILLTVAAGLLLAAPATESSAAKKRVTRAEPAEEPELEPPTMEERTEVFGAVDEAFSAGRKGEVADLLVEIVDNEEIHLSLIHI